MLDDVSAGEYRAAIAREALHEWALRQITRARVIARLAPREGAGTAGCGAKGD